MGDWEARSGESRWKGVKSLSSINPGFKHFKLVSVSHLKIEVYQGKNQSLQECEFMIHADYTGTYSYVNLPSEMTITLLFES